MCGVEVRFVARELVLRAAMVRTLSAIWGATRCSAGDAFAFAATGTEL